MKYTLLFVPLVLSLVACTQNQATSCIQSWWDWDSQKSICFIREVTSGYTQSWSLGNSWNTLPAQTYTGKAISVEEINQLVESRTKPYQKITIDLISSQERQGFALWAKEQNFTRQILASTGKLQGDEYFVLTQSGNIADKGFDGQHGCGIYSEGTCYLFVKVAWEFTPVFLDNDMSISSIIWSSDSGWEIIQTIGDGGAFMEAHTFFTKDGQSVSQFTRKSFEDGPERLTKGLSIGDYHLQTYVSEGNSEDSLIAKNLFIAGYNMKDSRWEDAPQFSEINIKFPDRYESRYLSGIESDRYNQPQKDFEIPFSNRTSYFLSFDTMKQWSEVISSKFNWWNTSLTYDKILLAERDGIFTLRSEGISFYPKNSWEKNELSNLQIWTCDPNNKNSYDSNPYKIQSYDIKKKSFEYHISEKFNNICTIPYVFDFFNSEGKHIYFPIVIEK